MNSVDLPTSFKKLCFMLCLRGLFPEGEGEETLSFSGDSSGALSCP